MFYKLGSHEALCTLGLVKAAQNPPQARRLNLPSGRPQAKPVPLKPATPPAPPKRGAGITMGGGTAQARRLRDMGILPR